MTTEVSPLAGVAGRTLSSDDSLQEDDPEGENPDEDEDGKPRKGTSAPEDTAGASSSLTASS